MHRLYSPPKNISGNEIIINDKGQVHHNRNVLRLKKNEEVVVFDDKGNEYRTILLGYSSKGMILKIVEKRNNALKSSKVGITIACAIPKGSCMDKIIDKLTQLNVDRIIPLETERVIVKLDKDKIGLRHERWKKIALNTSLQSQRSLLPILEPVKSIKELLSDLGGFDLKLIPALTGDRKLLKEVLKEFKPKNILAIVGPEGDFTSEELDSAKKAGCIPVSLGDSVLRVETAAITAAGFIRLYYEES